MKTTKIDSCFISCGIEDAIFSPDEKVCIRCGGQKDLTTEKTFKFVSYSNRKNNKSLYIEIEVDVCKTCLKSYQSCRECGKKIMYRSVSTVLDSCDICSEKNASIHNYNTKNIPVFYNQNGISRMKKKNIYFGLELEYEFSDEVPISKPANIIQGIFKKFAFLKYDGTLNRGFEIVTNPATIGYHKIVWKRFFNRQKELKFRSEKNCGMHVHVGVANLEHRHERTIQRLINLICSNKMFMEYFGRKENRWCTYTTDNEHYSAINVTRNGTVEFRFFDSPKTYEELINNLEFLTAMIDYSSYEGTMPSGSSHYNQFLKYVLNSENEYPNLKEKVGAFLKQRDSYINFKKGRGVEVDDNFNTTVQLIPGYRFVPRKEKNIYNKTVEKLKSL